MKSKDMRTKIMILLVIALMGGFGTVAFFCRMFDVALFQLSFLTILGLTVGASGIYLALFLIE